MTGTQLFWLLIILGIIASFTTMVSVAITHQHTDHHSGRSQLPHWSSTISDVKPDERKYK